MSRFRRIWMKLAMVAGIGVVAGGGIECDLDGFEIDIDDDGYYAVPVYYDYGPPVYYDPFWPCCW